jgi:hypothetical protein
VTDARYYRSLVKRHMAEARSIRLHGRLHREGWEPRSVRHHVDMARVFHLIARTHDAIDASRSMIARG